MSPIVIAGDGIAVHETTADSGRIVYTVGVDQKWLREKINDHIARIALSWSSKVRRGVLEDE